MPLNVGSQLGPYKVTAKIGEGGRGEVYQARDNQEWLIVGSSPKG